MGIDKKADNAVVRQIFKENPELFAVVKIVKRHTEEIDGVRASYTDSYLYSRSLQLTSNSQQEIEGTLSELVNSAILCTVEIPKDYENNRRDFSERLLRLNSLVISFIDRKLKNLEN